MSKPDMQALKDGSVTSQNNLRLGEQCDDQYLGSNCQYSIVAVYTCINIPFVLLQRGAAESALHCRSLAWPAPNKDRWPVLKTDGWVFGLQQIGLRRPLNQGMAPPVLGPTSSLLLSSDKTNRFPPPPCYRYTHTGFLVCTVMATPVITPLMVMGPLIRM